MTPASPIAVHRSPRAVAPHLTPRIQLVDRDVPRTQEQEGFHGGPGPTPQYLNQTLYAQEPGPASSSWLVSTESK